MTTWREAKAADYGGIERCHRQMETRLGESLDLPRFDDPAILSWLVAERDGEIVQFGYFEKLVEFKMGGLDREAIAELIARSDSIVALTARAGVRFIHIPVPGQVAKPVGRYLGRAHFDRSPNVLFSRRLR